MMERLDGPLADLISAEKEEMAALPKGRDAALAGIAAAWAPVPPTPPVGVAEAAATTGKAAGAGVLKVVAALVVGSSIAAGTWVSTRNEPPPIVRVEAPAEAVVLEAPARERPLVPELAPPPPAPVRPERVRETPAPRVATKPAPSPRSGLAEELALIDAMRKDVSAGRYTEALARAKQHRESFAKGSLTADRLDLEAAARCGRGDLEAGRTLAERKAERWPRAPISERLRTLCRLDPR